MSEENKPWSLDTYLRVIGKATSLGQLQTTADSAVSELDLPDDEWSRLMEAVHRKKVELIGGGQI